MNNIIILKSFLNKFKVQILLTFLAYLSVSIFAYKFVNSSSTYFLEYQISNEPKKNSNLEILNEKYDFLFNCLSHSYSYICQGKFELNNFVSCLNQNSCSDYFNLSDHLNKLKELIEMNAINKFEISFVENQKILITIQNVSKEDGMEFNNILKRSIDDFNLYLNKKIFLSFDDFKQELIESSQSKLNLKNEYFTNLSLEDKNLIDYFKTIYDLNILYSDIFSNELENFKDSLDKFEFKIDTYDFIIQSRVFFTLSQYLAISLLTFIWTITLLFFIKKNSLYS